MKNNMSASNRHSDAPLSVCTEPLIEIGGQESGVQATRHRKIDKELVSTRVYVLVSGSEINREMKWRENSRMIYYQKLADCF